MQEYVELETEQPDSNPAEKERVHRLNAEVRALSRLVERETDVFISGSPVQSKWVALAEKLIEYDEILMEKADGVYEMVQARYERRLQAGNPPVSEEFRAILTILGDGCTTIDRINEKLPRVVLAGERASVEAVSEVYWEKLSKAIEQWQPGRDSVDTQGPA